MHGEGRIHVEQAPIGEGMASEHCLLRARIVLTRGRRDPVGADTGHGPVVDCDPVFEEGLQHGRAHFVGEIHVREQRVAPAGIRALAHVQQ